METTVCVWFPLHNSTAGSDGFQVKSIRLDSSCVWQTADGQVLGFNPRGSCNGSVGCRSQEVIRHNLMCSTAGHSGTVKSLGMGDVQSHAALPASSSASMSTVELA